ncbi:MAG TPA: ATP-binding protein [Tepidisphaeraceae bacterium]|jgi:exonuclease SbcC
MIRRIILENYMAHVRTVIEPAEGLTVLIGPNNCGKSAIIHALEMICYNSDAADFAIRHGSKKATVTIETQDEDGTGHSISWWRKEKTAGYVIDGREISGLGRGKIPDDLHDHLRMPMIESAAGGKEFLLHFGLQKSPIFLLDDPPSRAAQFFASATDADKLMQMQKTHQQKTTYAKRDKDKLDGELAQLDRQLETLRSLPALSERLTDLEDDHQRLNDLGTQIASLIQIVQGLELHGKRAAHSARHVSSLTALEKPPTLENTERLAEWIQSAAHALADSSRSQARGKALRELRQPPELSATEALRQACRDMDNAARRTVTERRRADIVGPLAPPSEPHDVPAVKVMISTIARSKEQCTNWETRRGAFATFAAPPDLDDVSQLTNLLRELVRWSAKLHRHELNRHALKPLLPAPTPNDSNALKQQINEITRAAEHKNRQAKQASTLARLAPPTEPLHLQPLADSIRQIDLTSREASSSREKLRQFDAQIEQFRREIDQWVIQNPRCNACGQTVSAELIMNGGHAHE